MYAFLLKDANIITIDHPLVRNCLHNARPFLSLTFWIDGIEFLYEQKLCILPMKTHPLENSNFKNVLTFPWIQNLANDFALTCFYLNDVSNMGTACVYSWLALSATLTVTWLHCSFLYFVPPLYFCSESDSMPVCNTVIQLRLRINWSVSPLRPGVTHTADHSSVSLNWLEVVCRTYTTIRRFTAPAGGESLSNLYLHTGIIYVNIHNSVNFHHYQNAIMRRSQQFWGFSIAGLGSTL
jgi:hypothetical protein